MRNQPEPSFPHQPRRLDSPPGFQTPAEEQGLLDDSQLERLVSQIEHLPKNACYPLQASFYERLMRCDLLLPVPSGANLTRELPLITLENLTQEKGLPLFTNEENLCRWLDEPTDYLVMPFTSLCGFALEARLDYVILNIAGPFGCEISFHDFSYMAEGLLPPPGPGQLARESDPKPGEIQIVKNTPMRLGHCRDFPKNLSDRLQQVFRHHENLIENAYLFDVGFHNGPLQPAVGIRMPESLESHWEGELWPNLQAVLHEMLEKHDVVNVFLLNQSGSLEKHLQDLTEPVYRS